MKNEKLWVWFDGGQIEQTLLGQEQYFIPGITFSERHDIPFVLRQLFDWAAARHKESEAAHCFEHSLSRLVDTLDLNQALNLVWCYMIVSSDRNEGLPINLDTIQTLLANSIKEQAQSVATDEQIRQMVLLVASKLPKLREDLKLGNEAPDAKN